MVIARKPETEANRHDRFDDNLSDPTAVLRITNRLLEIGNSHSSMRPLLDSFTAEIKAITGCQAVGIRVLDEQGNIPYQSSAGFSPGFYREENDLSIHKDSCVCVDIISGNRKPHLRPYYTDYGSFLMGSITRHRAAHPRPTGQKPGRGACRLFGYDTLALIPILQGERVLGLIHLVDSRADVVSQAMVSLLEKIAMQLGTALSRVQTEELLQSYRYRLEEMVQERTSQLRQLNEKLTAEVSQRQEISEELRHSRDKLRLMIAQMPCIVWTMDKELRYTSMSGAGLKTAGRQPSDLVGKTIFEYSPTFTEASPLVRALRRALKGQANTCEQGSILNNRMFLVHSEPMYDNDQSICGVVGVSVDITEQKRAQHELAAKEQRVHDLVKAYIKAQDDEREWLSLEIHDRIIQPMAAVFQQLQGALPLIDECPDSRPNLERAVELTDTVIRETRAVMKELHPTTLNRYGLPKLINEELKHFKAETGCRTRFNLTDNYQGYPTLEKTFYRVFHEALLNIRKYARASQVTVSLKKIDDKLELRVTDNGIGFEPEKLTDEPGGLICMRRRTELLGGSFNIRSRPGKGTKIVSRLPVNNLSAELP